MMMDGDRSESSSAKAPLFGSYPFSLVSDYGLAILLSIILHGLLIYMMSHSWASKPETRKINPPKSIQAELVKLTPKAPPATPKQAKQTKPKPVQKKEVVKKTPKPKPKPKSKPAVKPKVEEKPKVVEKLKPEKPVDNSEKQKKQAEQALLAALAQEDEFVQNQTDTELAQGYASLIKQRVEQNWSRPPSTKYGMEVLLEIHLVPTGHVVDVKILKGSGNSAFDLSAERAVRKVERFIEIKEMPSRLFESQFRRFQLLFRPEDKLS